jgi:hypothetical protein
MSALCAHRVAIKEREREREREREKERERRETRDERRETRERERERERERQDERVESAFCKARLLADRDADFCGGSHLFAKMRRIKADGWAGANLQCLQGFTS